MVKLYFCMILPLYMRRIAIIIVLSLIWHSGNAQQKRKVLLTDMNIQLESTDAVNYMYNFEFDRAIHGFKYLRYRYPNHPMPYFLIGFAYWWRMQPDVTSITEHDDIFISYMDSTIMFAEKIYDEDEENIDAIFFLSAANGFLARIHGERENYVRATNAGRKCISYMEEGKQFSEFSSEFLFGQGLYNYYEPWIKENYKYLRPVLMFFENGDKPKGVEQLLEVSKTAFYTRTESKYFLIDILREEGRLEESLNIVSALAETFPDNPVFQKEFAKLCYGKAEYSERVEATCLKIIDRMDRGKEGYTAHIGRQAAYFLGHIYQYYRKNGEKAKSYYSRNIAMTEDIELYESNYYHHSLYEVGKMEQNAGNYDKADEYFEKVVKHANKKHRLHKEAKKLLKENKKRK